MSEKVGQFLTYYSVSEQTFHISHVRIAQIVKGVLMWSFKHIIFIMKTKMLADYQICVSAPLRPL